MTPRRMMAAALVASAVALSLPGSDAGAGEGFVLSQSLHVVTSSGETEAVGGVEAWLRVTNAHTVVQSFRVWCKGLSETEDGATLWMAAPGTSELEEVAPLALAANGTGQWRVYVDSGWETNAELPLGVERILDLQGGLIEIRRPGAGLEDEPFLAGTIGDARWRDIPSPDGSPGSRVKRARLHRPPEPVVAPDSTARGTVRLWRQRKRGDIATLEQGLDLFAQGLTEDETYEVWIEDAAGVMVWIEDIDSTSEGMAMFSIDTRYGDLLPAEADVETVRDFARRRLELRRVDYEDPSLVAVLPRIR